jgi:hypothetical protein
VRRPRGSPPPDLFDDRPVIRWNRPVAGTRVPEKVYGGTVVLVGRSAADGRVYVVTRVRADRAFRADVLARLRRAGWGSWAYAWSTVGSCGVGSGGASPFASEWEARERADARERGRAPRRKLARR